MYFREIPTIRYLFCVHKKTALHIVLSGMLQRDKAGNTNFLKNNLLNLNPNSH